MKCYSCVDGKVIKAEICTLPGGESGGGEWCKEYCLYYGTGRCEYDPNTRRMLIYDKER